MNTVLKIFWFLFLFSFLSVTSFTNIISAHDLTISSVSFQKRMMEKDRMHGLDTSTSYSATGGSKSGQNMYPRPTHGEDTKTSYRLDANAAGLHHDKGSQSGKVKMFHVPSSSKSSPIEESSSSHSGGSDSEKVRKPDTIYLKPKYDTYALSQDLKTGDSKFKNTYKKFNSKWTDKSLTLRQKLTRKESKPSLPRYSSIPGYEKRVDKYPVPKITLNPEFHQANRQFEKTFAENNKGRQNRKSRAQARERLNTIHKKIEPGWGGEGVLINEHARSSDVSHTPRSVAQSHSSRSSSSLSVGRQKSLPYTPKHEDEAALVRSTSGISSGHSHSPGSSPKANGKSIVAMNIDHSSNRESKYGSKSRRTHRTLTL